MDVDVPTSTGQPIVARDKTSPFLIRTFVKIGSFHRLSLFEDGTLPTTDEQQIFTWRDATLREVLTTLRNTAPHVTEFRHPLARFSFRTVYADSANRGRFAQKDLGMVYSRDILGEPGALDVTAPRLLEDVDGENRELTEREKEERTLEELRFVPGDYLLVAVLLPKNVTMPNEVATKVSAGSRKVGLARGEAGWGTPASGIGRGSGGHWRGGDVNHPPPGSRGRGRNGGNAENARVPPPRRRDSSPARGGYNRNGRNDRRSRSRSPRRRYD